MKKTLISALALICVCTFILTFSACDIKNDQKVDSSTTESQTQSPITEKQIWLCYTTIIQNEQCKYSYYYDEYGNEIKKVQEDLSGNFKAEWIYEYDDNQNLIKTTVDTKEREPFVQLIQIYDDNGNLIEKQVFSLASESIYTYHYDEQNRPIYKKNGDEIVERYIYNTDGSYKIQNANLSNEYTLYNADGKIQERHSFDLKTVYSYNEDGVLLECVTYSGGEITNKTICYLDENGNAIKTSNVNSSGNETVISESEYRQYTVKVK